MAAHDGKEGSVGRRSQFTSRQKLEIVLSVLTKETTVAAACRAHGITETTFHRWKEQAVSGMERGLEGKAAASSKEAELAKEVEELERTLGRMTRIADLRGKALRQLT